MIPIYSKAELITERYENLREQMTPDIRINIFPVSSWMEPWGFGRDNKAIATKLYNEFMSVQCADNIDSISEVEYTDEVIIVMHTQTQIGIVFISEDEEMHRENVEDLINYLIIGNTIPKLSKPEDNLVVPKMSIFK